MIGSPVDTAKRVLGIDTSLRSAGIAALEARGNRVTALEFGCIQTPGRYPHSECLRRLYQGVGEWIQRWSPAEVAIEGVFFCKNVKVAVILGEARGSVLAACATAGLPIYEYSPRRVKQATVGFGAADKVQVRKMVMSILGLQEEPQEDAGDAMAIAICHLHSLTSVAALAPRAL